MARAPSHPEALYSSPLVMRTMHCLRQETEAFTSRTGASVTAWQVLHSWWELLSPLEPYTEVLLDNSICPLPDGCSVRKVSALGWLPCRQLSCKGKRIGEGQAVGWQCSWKRHVSLTAAHQSTRRWPQFPEAKNYF